MHTTDMHRLAGAESAIRAELEAARIKTRQQLAPVGLDLQGRHATRPAPLWADTEIEPDDRIEPASGQTRSAAEVYHSADVQRAARWLRIRTALIEAEWWLAVPVATACAYALARN